MLRLNRNLCRMATIQTAINILENVGNAMVGLGKFMYTQRADINAYQSKQYPLLLVDRNVSIPQFNIEKAQQRLTVRLQFFGVYQDAQASKRTDQVPQVDLETLALQYLTEVRRLYNENGRIQIIDSTLTNGGYAFNVNNDKLIRLELFLSINIHGTCTEGEFNYGVG